MTRASYKYFYLLFAAALLSLIMSFARASELPPLGERISNTRLPSVKEALRYGLSSLSETNCNQNMGARRFVFDLNEVPNALLSASTTHEFFGGTEDGSALIYRKQIRNFPEMYYYFFTTDDSGVFITNVEWEIYSVKIVRVILGRSEIHRWLIKRLFQKFRVGAALTREKVAHATSMGRKLYFEIVSVTHLYPFDTRE